MSDTYMGHRTLPFPCIRESNTAVKRLAEIIARIIDEYTLILTLILSADLFIFSINILTDRRKLWITGWIELQGFILSNYHSLTTEIIT